MRTTTRTLFVLGAVVTAAGAPSIGAQQPQRVRVEQTFERRPQRADSLIDTLLTGGVESVKRIVIAWRERETKLVRDARAVPQGDLIARRRLDEQLAMHNREGFAIMSAIQARCMNEDGPRPPGYLGLNLTFVFELGPNQPKSVMTMVTSVEPGSPAERAGIIREDKVLTLGGLDATQRPPDISPQLIPGRTITARIERDGAPREFALTVARRPEGFGDSCREIEREIAPIRLSGAMFMEESGTRLRRPSVTRDVPDPSESGGRLQIVVFGSPTSEAPGFFAGAEFRSLDADWVEVLGVRQGVIVNTVADGSASALAGLKGGDVITAVGRSPVATPVMLVQLLGTMEEREAVLSIVRKKERKTITLKWSGR